MNLEKRIYKYVIATWYESKCKDKEKIKQIIHEEITQNPELENLKFTKKCLIIKRRCMSEL